MADDGGVNNNNVFIYRGGDQVVPRDATHVIVDRSVDTITRRAFQNRRRGVSIDVHDGVEIIEEDAFRDFTELESITLPGVRVIGRSAFFSEDSYLRNITLPKVEVIGPGAFTACYRLTELDFSKDLQSIQGGAFYGCHHLRRIAIPLKDDLFDDGGVFDGCNNLTQVDLVGGIHKAISSLLLESWRDEMKEEIDRINHELPDLPEDESFLLRPDPNNDLKTTAIKNWLESVIVKIDYYTSAHYELLKDNMTQLELALWKAQLYVEEANLPDVDAAASRHDARVKCGANVIIPLVLPFLNDQDVFPLLDSYLEDTEYDDDYEGYGESEESDEDYSDDDEE